MDRFSFITTSITWSVVVIFVSWALTWVVIGALNCFPNAEDIALSSLAMEQGLIGSVVKLLQIYDGRYFTNILHALNPLVWGCYMCYQWMPLIGLFFLSFSLYFLLSSLDVQEKWRLKALLLSILYVVVHVSVTPSLPHDLYWMVSSFVYMWPWSLLFFFLGSLARYLSSPSELWRNIWFISALVSLVCGIGMNEMFLVVYTSVFMMLIFYVMTRDKHKAVRLLPIILVGLTSMAFFVTCPGINRRLADQEVVRNTGHAVAVLLASSKHLLYFLKALFLDNLIMIPWAILASIALPDSVQARLSGLSWSSALLIAAISIMFLCAMTWPYYWAMGADPIAPSRIQTSQLYGIQLWVWFVSAWIWSYLGTRKIIMATKHSAFQCLPLFLAAIMLTDTVFSANNISALRQEYVTGVLGGYRNRMLHDHRLLSKGSDTSFWSVVVIDPMEVLPLTVSHPPLLHPNRSASYWNASYERYYGLQEVRLSTDTISKLDQMIFNGSR